MNAGRALVACVLALTLGGVARAQDAGVPDEPLREDAAASSREHEAGLRALRAGDTDGAIAALRRAVTLGPRSAAAWNDLGFALAKTGAVVEAEGAYDRALVLDPARSYAYVNLAELLAGSAERWRRRDEIVRRLERGLAALEADARGRQSVSLALALFLRSVGRADEARKRIDEVLGSQPAVAVRKRALDLLAGIEEDARALTLSDWPEARLSDAERASLRTASSRLGRGDVNAALERATALVTSRPTATEPRFLRARALEGLGRHDEAVRELGIVLQLRPSHAGAWRLLGVLLATHGGALEADRADEALRRALALEPAWDDLRALRVEVAKKRAKPVERVQPAAGPPATAQRKADALYEDAQRWLRLDLPELAQATLEEALAAWPGHAPSAAALYALTGTMHDATVRALWEDGPALAQLATEVRKVRREEATTALVGPWLDQAIAKGASEALYDRAVLRAARGDDRGALDDLAAYVASGLAPSHLAEARALRASLAARASISTSPVAMARALLLDDRLAEARRTLGGTCRASQASDALVALGRVEELEGHRAEAVACHRLALAAAERTRDRGAETAALERLARMGASGPAVELRTLERDLVRARRHGVPIAAFALARLAREDGQRDEALHFLDAFLAEAPEDEPLRAEASALADELHRKDADDRAAFRSQAGRLGVAAVAVLSLVLMALVVRRVRGTTVTRALSRAPDLYPEVAQTVAELRHDLLKHRASALGALSVPAGVDVASVRAEVAAMLLEPVPASEVIASAYERLRRAAAATGLTLRPLPREPVFGPLAAALARAEALLGARANDSIAEQATVIDRELREVHGPALASLLGEAPRTPVDAATVGEWIRAARAEDVRPGLHLPALAVDVPVTREVLSAVVTNLVRNAAAAVRDAADPRVLVRIDEERDVTGRRLVTVLVLDTAAAPLDLAAIEARDGQRGLGIVRDLVRRWGGHVVVRAEAAPYTKAVGAAFPLVGGAEPSREAA